MVIRAQTPPCPLSHPNELESDKAVHLDKLGLIEIWDWLAQVRDELSIETLRQKQQGEIDEPTYVYVCANQDQVGGLNNEVHGGQEEEELGSTHRPNQVVPSGTEMAHPRRAQCAQTTGTAGTLDLGALATSSRSLARRLDGWSRSHSIRL